MIRKRAQGTYDHRLVRLVQETADITIATKLGVPRSTAAGWVRRAKKPVTTAPDLDSSPDRLRARVLKLERRLRLLLAVLRVLFAVIRTLRVDLSRHRVELANKARLLRAIERSRGIVRLRRVLRIAGLSPARLHAWRRAAQACELQDQPSCPGSAPHRLTVEEISGIHEMVTSPDYRHVPTSRLSMLAQRLSRVFACTATWNRLVRERGWRRPRFRAHPEQPQIGIRATRSNQILHVDTTVIRLLDGTKAYLHAVIDNFSRRILSWRLADKFEIGNSVAVLVEAGRALTGSTPPTLIADSGVENRNLAVDELIDSGLLRRVLAMTEINFSNSMIEAWWRCLKHNWLFLNPLDTVARLRKLVAFYVEEHNSRLPHSAFCG